MTICCLQFSNTLIWVFWLMFKTSDCLQSAYTKGQIRHSYVVCVLPERESFNRQKLLDKANFYLFTVQPTHLVSVRQWYPVSLALVISVTHFYFSFSYFLSGLCNFCITPSPFFPLKQLCLRQFQTPLLFHHWNNTSWHLGTIFRFLELAVLWDYKETGFILLSHCFWKTQQI